MGKVNLRKFLGVARTQPLDLIAKYSFLSLPSKVIYDRDFVIDRLQSAERRYLRGDFQGAISSGFDALFSLSAARFAQPKSRRDSDPDAERLLLFVRLSALLDKASAWLGLSDVGLVKTIDIAKDMRKAFEALGDSESANRVLSMQGYFLLRSGEYRRAEYTIEEGLAQVKGPFARRDLLGAKASLKARLGQNREARDLYEICWRTDEWKGNQPGAALARASWGILSAKLGPAHRMQWLDSVMRDVEELRRIGHKGFEFQVRRAVAEYFIGVGEFSEAERLISDVIHERGSSDQNRISRDKLNALQRYLVGSREHRAGRKQFIIGSPGKNKVVRLYEDKDQYLNDTFECLNRYLLEGNVMKSIEQVCVAVERLTNILIKINALSVEDDRLGTLPEKNAVLLDAGVYSKDDSDRVAFLVQVRNQILHGNIEGIYISRLSRLSSLIEMSAWLFHLAGSCGVGYTSSRPIEGFKRGMVLFRN